MGGVRAVSAGVVVTAVALLGVATAAPAHADQVVVQGTAFPDPARTTLSYVGCADAYQRSAETLRPTISQGPGAAPAGARSVGFDLAGGNAVGALFTVGSVLTTSTASLTVNAVGPARGVAYAGYQEPADAGTSRLWLGRSELSTPGGAWQTVEATTRSYTWVKYDMRARDVVDPGTRVPTTVAGFAAAHGGDGPGLFTIGFGCDGTAFSIDALRIDATTYDLEGLRTQVDISADRLEVRAGQSVTLSGLLTTGTGDPVPHATMILERRSEGAEGWEQVAVVPVGPGGVARAQVEPEADALYRWRFVDRPLAEASTSMALGLEVLPEPSPSSSPTPRPTPTSTPSPEPSTLEPSVTDESTAATGSEPPWSPSTSDPPPPHSPTSSEASATTS